MKDLTGGFYSLGNARIKITGKTDENYICSVRKQNKQTVVKLLGINYLNNCEELKRII
tara:strand:+ start:57546 stop:57719 length:174 start_codon:yes stop_codon:yes gene_type:complete